MRRPEYTSVFKDEINEYIDFKIENGYEELSFKTNLRNFDRFCVENSLNKKTKSSVLKKQQTAFKQGRKI